MFLQGVDGRFPQNPYADGIPHFHVLAMDGAQSLPTPKDVFHASTC
jgi:hypothetical protein